MTDWIKEALDRAERVLKKAKVDRFEIAASELYSAAVEAMDGEIHVVERSIERALGIRILDGGIGFAGLSEPTDDDIEEAIALARAEARRSRRASIEDFAGPSSSPIPRIDDLEDPRAIGTAKSLLSDLALELEAKALKGPKIARIRPARIDEQRGAFAFRTSRGLDLVERHSRASAVVGAIAEDDDDAQSSYASVSAGSAEALAPELEAIAREASDRARRLLGATSFSTGRVPIIFGFEAVADLVSLVAGALEADRIERGASFFGRPSAPEGRGSTIGERALHPAFTLVDDPHDGTLDGACAIDGEGLITARRALIDRGVIAAILDDRESAARAGRSPNAQAVRSAASVRPMPGAHNLVLLPGPRPSDDLYRQAEGGLYVHELSGTHTVNEVTGELSLGAKGWNVTGGAWGRAIEGVTVSGTLTEMLSQEIALSSESRKLGALSVPILLLSELQVSS